MNNFNYDPLLGNRQYSIPQIEEAIERQQQQLGNLKQQMQTQQPSAPTWDEIERLTSALSEKEFDYLQNNQEFQESSMVIQQILQREYMRIMRPIVESTKDGKDALDKHLTLLKRIEKTAKDETAKRDALMNEYIMQYSHLTWQEFMDMKNGKTKRSAK